MKLINILILLLLIPIVSAITIDNPSQTFNFTNVTVNFSSNQTYDSIELNTNSISISGSTFQITSSPYTLNIIINTWNITGIGNYTKNFNESSSTGTNEVRYHVKSVPSSNHTVKIYWNNGTKFQDFYIISNSTGYINYNNTGFEYPRYTVITYINTPSNPYPVLIITVTVIIGGVYYYLKRIRKS